MKWKEMTPAQKIATVISAVLLVSYLVITIMSDVNYLKNTRTIEYLLKIGAFAGIGFASQQTMCYFYCAFLVLLWILPLLIH